MLLTSKGSKSVLLVIVLVMIIACSDTPPTRWPTPSPRPKPTSLPAPTPVWIQIGFWDGSPSPAWSKGTTIILYSVDEKLILKSHYFDGSTKVEELVRSSNQEERYDVVGVTSEYYVGQYDDLLAYGDTGLIWVASCNAPYYSDGLLGCHGP